VWGKKDRGLIRRGNSTSWGAEKKRGGNTCEPGQWGEGEKKGGNRAVWITSAPKGGIGLGGGRSKKEGLRRGSWLGGN